jgi:transposase
MVLLSSHGLSAAQIAGLLECHPATVLRWVSRFNAEGLAGLADRPRRGRPRLGGKRLARRIAALLERPGRWTLPRIWRYLSRPDVSLRTLYRRVRQGASWTPRGARPQIRTPGTNRQVTVYGALELTTGRWVYRLGTAALPNSSPSCGCSRRPSRPPR